MYSFHPLKTFPFIKSSISHGPSESNVFSNVVCLQKSLVEIREWGLRKVCLLSISPLPKTSPRVCCSSQSVFLSLCDTDCSPSCGEEQFKCSNGCCVKKEFECDGLQQCSDGSDENNCEQCETRHHNHTHTHLMTCTPFLNLLLLLFSE